MPKLPCEILKKFFFRDGKGKDLAQDCDGTWEKMRTLSQKLDRAVMSGSETH